MTGVGEYYSSGNDLANFMSVDLSNKEKVESLMKQSKSMMIEYIDAFIDFPKILISCVNGKVKIYFHYYWFIYPNLNFRTIYWYCNNSFSSL